jgi:phosphatidylserine/phosphatidylglycerophosphate/cardiolipin synthase-like enzyme
MQVMFFFLLLLLAGPAWADSYRPMYCHVTEDGTDCGVKYLPPTDPQIQVHFSPNEGSTEAVVAVIAGAEKSIHVAGYGFTSKPIAEALVAAEKRGVEVRLVLDKSNVSARFSEAGEVAASGIPVRIDYRYAIMHDKFVVVDGVTVETGSFNFTSAAERSNAENVLVLHGSPEVAAKYEENWLRMWNESEPFK